MNKSNVTGIKPTFRDIENLFDLQFKSNKAGQLTKVHGFHHNYLRTLERSGLIKVLEEKAGPAGSYWIKFEVNGIEDTKTLFPAEWTSTQCH